jgi:hypothetical protein
MKAKSAVHKMEGRKNKMSNYANQIFDMLGVSENAISRTVNSSGGKSGFRKYIRVKLD